MKLNNKIEIRSPKATFLSKFGILVQKVVDIILEFIELYEMYREKFFCQYRLVCNKNTYERF